MAPAAPEPSSAPPSFPPAGSPDTGARADVTRTLQSAAELLANGRDVDAVHVLQRWHVHAGAPDADVDYVLGVASYRAGDMPAAESAFRRCLRTDPGRAAAQHGLGTALREQHRAEEARAAFATALELDPELAGSRTALADLEQRFPSLAPAAQPATRSAGSIGRARPLPSPFAAVMPGPGPTSSAADVPRVTPYSAPPTGPGLSPAPGTDGAAVSLAELLDVREPHRPRVDDLRGQEIWSGRPAVRSMLPGVLAPFLLFLIPFGLHAMADALPAGSARSFLAWGWHVAFAAWLPVAVVLAAGALAHWALSSYTLRERRLEVWTGLFRRNHIVLWLHDIERPATVQQSVPSILLNLGTIQLYSTILPARGRRRLLSGQLGTLSLAGLPIRVAEALAGTLWSYALWERRRMVATFVSSR